MTLTLAQMLVGNFLTFCRAGDTVDAVLVGSGAKPDHSPSTNWTPFGSIESANVNPELTEEDYYAPLASGGYGRANIFTKTSKLTIQLVVGDMNEIIFQLLLLSTNLSAGAGVPMSASGQLYGWWNVTQVDQSGVTQNTFEVWARAKVNAQKFDNAQTKATLVLDVLTNSLNVMTVAI